MIISATSDIGTEMCIQWKNKGWTLSGTYYSKGDNYQKLKKNGVALFPCNLLDKTSVDNTAKMLGEYNQDWDILIFAPGSQVPVGPFDRVDIDEWSSSIHLNFLNQMRMLHRLLPFRAAAPKEKSVLFFAGGGTNNAVINYSAYTVSKIALIKMCELLDAEIPDVKFSIIGPGWVKTKIHEATLKAGEKWAGSNFEKTQMKLSSDECVPVQKVIDSFEWVISQPRKVVSGRNFSTVFDKWGSEELTHQLSNNQDMYKLRRFGN